MTDCCRAWKRIIFQEVRWDKSRTLGTITLTLFGVIHCPHSGFTIYGWSIRELRRSEKGWCVENEKERDRDVLGRERCLGKWEWQLIWQKWMGVEWQIKLNGGSNKEQKIQKKARNKGSVQSRSQGDRRARGPSREDYLCMSMRDRNSVGLVVSSLLNCKVASSTKLDCQDWNEGWLRSKIFLFLFSKFAMPMIDE